MSLSLSAIYKPLNDFLIENFKSGEDSPIKFRLQKYGVSVDSNDFVEDNDPQEEFSDLVNKVPVLDPNDINVEFLMNDIDDTYQLIWKEALPYTDESTDPAERPLIEQGVVRLKAEADRIWNKYLRVRGNGIPDEYLLTGATPSKWYDLSGNHWERKEFNITQKAGDDGDDQILRIRLTDKELLKAIPAFKAKQNVASKELSRAVLMKTLTLNSVRETESKINDHKIFLKSDPRILSKNLQQLKSVQLAKNQAVALKKASLRSKMIKFNTVKTESEVKKDQNKSQVGLNFSKAFKQLRFNDQIYVRNYIKEVSPKDKVDTNSISIKFDYCYVRIDRPWFSEMLCIANRSWYIPGWRTGSLNDNVQFCYMPIGFVAIKDLEISSNWSQADKEKLKDVTSFGPFDISGENIFEKNTLSKKGIQIIGWMLQELPALPPNEKTNS